MGKKVHLNHGAEKEATDIGKKFMNSTDVVGDMSRAYGADLSSVQLHTDDGAARKAAEHGVDAVSTGKDVFFGRGVFDRSAPASRGLLAHELGHSLQQGAGGAMGSVTQSVPMGAAQGGLLEWFRGLFGGRGAAEETGESETDAVPAVEAVPEETEIQEEFVPAAADDPARELRDAKENLLRSPRAGGGQNSEKFIRVTDALSASIGELSHALGGNAAQDKGVLARAAETFTGLIAACDDYLKRSAWTDKGKKRQDIVRYLRGVASDDRRGFFRYMAVLGEGTQAASVLEVLRESRQRTLTLNGDRKADLQLAEKNEADLQHVGGAASYIAKIEKGMLTDQDVSGYFKEEESFTKLSERKDVYLDSVEKTRRRKPLSDEHFQIIRDSVEKTGGLAQMKKHELYQTNRAFHEFVDAAQSGTSAYDAIAANLQNPLKTGESLSLSKRNVATSRLAELLGLGDLVAKSETAKLVDGDGEGSRVGNLMQEAKGTEVKSFVIDRMYDAHKEGRKDGKLDKFTTVKHQGIDDAITPEFMQSLISLQVLDNLAAQEDRHYENYFSEVRGGRLGKVQGIDNDFSFGSRDMSWAAGKNAMGVHGRNILDKKGKLMLPYMDRGLAERILTLEEEDLRLVMADVLEPWAVDALCTRFHQIQTAIRTDFGKKGDNGRYLTNTSDWGKAKVFQALRRGHVKQENGEHYASNYVSNLLMATETADERNASSMDIHKALDDEVKIRLVKEVLAEISQKNPEDAKTMFREYGVSATVISYLENTGQLKDGPALLKRVPDADLYSPISAAALKKIRAQYAKK